MARADGGHVGLVAGCMAVAAGAGFGEAEVDHRAQGQRGRDGLDVLTLNLCLAGVAVGVGALFKQILMQISPLFDAVPVFPPAMVGGLLSMVGLVWNVLMVLLLKAFSFKPLLFEPFLGGGLITAFAPLAISSMGLGRWPALCLAFTLGALVVGLRLLGAVRSRGEGTRP
jgi:hypothetical protein